MKKLLAMICALVLCLSLAACGGGNGGGNAGGDSGSGGSSGGDVKIAYIPKERNESFWQAVEAGAQQAAKDRGVDLIMYGDAAGANTAALQAAQAAGISVVGFDSDPGEEARDWFVNQVDPAALAEILLDDLVTNIGDKYSASSPAVVYLTTPNQNTWIEHLKATY